jgi:phytanoyl-CoA hydroxylase
VLWMKVARGGTLLPWHQDGGRFWGLDRDPTLQIWTALDDAPLDGGCLEVVPGTHRAGLVTPFGGQVAEAAQEQQHAASRAMALPARAGEAFLLHNHLWHRSGLNHTASPRRAVSISFMDAATRCVRKKHAPRTFVRVFEG